MNLKTGGLYEYIDVKTTSNRIFFVIPRLILYFAALIFMRGGLVIAEYLRLRKKRILRSF